MSKKQTCQHQGCSLPSILCWRTDPNGYGYWEEWYCPNHAFEYGYCALCGVFSAGIEKFDFGNGYCDYCKDQIEGLDEDDFFEDTDALYQCF